MGISFHPFDLYVASGENSKLVVIVCVGKDDLDGTVSFCYCVVIEITSLLAEVRLHIDHHQTLHKQELHAPGHLFVPLF